MEVVKIDTGSPEYMQACRLRYRVLFDECGGFVECICDSLEESSIHVVAEEGDEVLACGRLSRTGPALWRISQMAVSESERGKGLGGRILATLVREVVSAGGGRVELAARTSAIRFYRRFGFSQEGEEFPSEKTGLPHVMMVQELSAN